MPIRTRTPKRSARVGFWRHWTLWVWFAVALVFCLGGVSLWKSGRWLVKEDRFDKVRWGVVLAGESRDCERSDAAIRLFQEGKIDTLVISATRVFKNRYNSEFMVDYYLQQGVPRDRVFEFRQDAYSTVEEARLLIRQFRLQNLDTVLIVTSSFHTARSRRIFRKLAQGYPVVLLASADYHVYDPNAWWSNREGMKTWFGEWVKTVFCWFELAGTPPETGKAEFQGLTPDVWGSRELDLSRGLPASDSAEASAEDSSDSPAGTASAADSARELPKEPGSVDTQSEADSVAAKADSVKAYKDSLKAAEGRQTAEPKDAGGGKKPPKMEKKKTTSAKSSSKASERKTEKGKSKK